MIVWFAAENIVDFVIRQKLAHNFVHVVTFNDCITVVSLAVERTIDDIICTYSHRMYIVLVVMF